MQLLHSSCFTIDAVQWRIVCCTTSGSALLQAGEEFSQNNIYTPG